MSDTLHTVNDPASGGRVDYPGSANFIRMSDTLHTVNDLASGGIIDLLRSVNLT